MTPSPDDIQAVMSRAIAARDVELLQACWWAQGYDNRAAFVPVCVGEQRRGLERVAKELSKEAA